MARWFTLLLVAVLVAACGGGSAPASAPAGGGGAEAGGGTDLPAATVVIFGTSYDPQSMAIGGRATQFKQGSPLVAVGKSLAQQDPSTVTVQIGASGTQRLAPRPVTASNGSDTFAADLTADNLTPGTWIVSFVSTNQRIVATGTVRITP